MADPRALTLAFLESRPHAAARVLLDLPAASAAAFLAEVPSALAGRTLAQMSPWGAARCLEAMDASRAALLLDDLDGAQSAQLLRLLDPQRAQAVLEFLPSRVAQAYRRSLAFPAGAVGAWTDHTLPALTAQDCVGDALRVYDELHAASPTHLYVLDDARALAGRVSARQLYSSPRATPVGALMERAVVSLPAALPITAAEGSQGWDDSLLLPVLDAHGAYLGGLTRAALRRGIEHERDRTDVGADYSITMQIATSSLITGVDLVSALLPHAGRPR